MDIKKMSFQEATDYINSSYSSKLNHDIISGADISKSLQEKDKNGNSIINYIKDPYLIEVILDNANKEHTRSKSNFNFFQKNDNGDSILHQIIKNTPQKELSEKINIFVSKAVEKYGSDMRLQEMLVASLQERVAFNDTNNAYSILSKIKTSNTHNALQSLDIAYLPNERRFYDEFFSKINVNSKTEFLDGGTLLHSLATKNNKMAAIKSILLAGADPTIKNNEGKDAFSVSIEDYQDTIRVYLNKKLTNNFEPLSPAYADKPEVEVVVKKHSSEQDGFSSDFQRKKLKI
ncbi:hypothetical protein ACVV7K_003803 [Cronobacter sakazakii]